MRNGLTVGELCDWYLEHARSGRILGRRRRPIKPATLDMDQSRIDTHKLRGRSIVKGGAGIADRTYSTLRATFNWAIDKGHFAGPNPCAKVERKLRPAVERFLSEAQAQDLIAALDALEADATISERQGAVYRLLLLTGARRNEIAGLRWTEVDFDRRRLVLPPSRTKAGGRTGDRRISLNDMAFGILQRLYKTRGRSQFVFPATKGDNGYATSESKIWRDKVLPKAKLEGIRIHDLRHSFASFALADGASLPMIGKALGHANSRATERYGGVGQSRERRPDFLTDPGHGPLTGSVRPPVGAFVRPWRRGSGRRNGPCRSPS